MASGGILSISSRVAATSISPGAMQLTLIPAGPSSRASGRVNPMTPAFAAAYACTPVRVLVRPATDETLTIAPRDPADFIERAASRQQ